MSNAYALMHARRLHTLGLRHDEINQYLSVLASKRERAEILRSLDACPAHAMAA